jgi:Methyltransferase domain
MAFAQPLITRRLTDYRQPNSVASRIRRRRLALLVDVIEACRRRRDPVRILDLGGTEDYWRLLPGSLLESGALEVTLLNLPGNGAPSADARFRFVEGDACALPDFETGAFDLVHSNSVLEHVGDWPRMVAFAREVRRLAPSYFVQTPYFWSPIEPHWMVPFFHWLPRPVRVGLFMRFDLGHGTRCETVGDAVLQVDSARLLDKRMFRCLFPDARHTTEYVLGVPKSLVAIRQGAE